MQDESNNLKFAQDVEILRMVYFDMFFLFLTERYQADGSVEQFLYLTKNLEILQEGGRRKEFRIHHSTVYIDKVINFDMKFLFTVGIDQCKLDNGGIQEQ